MKKNDVCILNITDVSTQGSGIGRAPDLMTVFVPGAAVGDELEVVIVKALKKFCFGKILKIIKPSNSRITPDCEAFSKCGGCCFRHISYDAEKLLKQSRVKNALERIGEINIDVPAVLSNDEINNYRNKGQYPIATDANGKMYAGFYSLHSHRVVKCENCLLQPKEFEIIVLKCLELFEKYQLSVYNEQNNTGILRHIYLRKSDLTGKTVVCIVINAKSLPFATEIAQEIAKIELVSGIIVNINQNKTNVILGKKYYTVYGNDCITDELLGVKFNISPSAFFQVNRKMTELLYKKVAEFAEPKGKIVLDLFCGAGTIGLSTASTAKQLIGVEVVESAIENAKQNAKMNKINNAVFICDTAEGAAQRLAANKIRPDVIILDPPRKGATPELVKTICQGFCPERIVYVSCDPATLARDLKQFCDKDYAVQRVQPVDLFPRTAHVESVVLLTKVHN